MHISHLEKDEWEGRVFRAKEAEGPKAQKGENVRNSKKMQGVDVRTERSTPAGFGHSQPLKSLSMRLTQCKHHYPMATENGTK